MLEIRKTAELAARNIPIGFVEVRYPERDAWHTDEFRELAKRELNETREKYKDYDRKAVFGENPYFRFFNFKNPTHCGNFRRCKCPSIIDFLAKCAWIA